MSNAYLEQSKASLLPLSVATEFANALKEWQCSGRVHIYEKPIETCQLCTKDGLKYHYEIENRQTHHALWVGSSCILKFPDIAVHDEAGEVVDGKERERVLDTHLQQAQRSKMFDECRNLFKALQAHPVQRGFDVWGRPIFDDTPKHTALQEVLLRIMRRAKDYSVREEDFQGFTPDDLVWIAVEMTAKGLEWTPALYKVRLRTKAQKQQVQQMNDKQFDALRPCLSAQQIRTACQLREP